MFLSLFTMPRPQILARSARRHPATSRIAAALAGFFALGSPLLAADALRGPGLQVTVNSGAVQLALLGAGAAAVPVLATENAAVRIRTASGETSCAIRTAELANGSLRLAGPCGELGEFEQHFALADDAAVVQVTTQVRLRHGVHVRSVEDQYSYLPEKHTLTAPTDAPLDFVWSQNIKSAPNDVVAANQFKSPAVMLQQGSVFAALLPALSRQHGPPLALDLDLTSEAKPWIAFGAIPTEPHDHSYFRRAADRDLDLPGAQYTEGEASFVTYRYALVLSSEPPKLGYRKAVRLLWQWSGHPSLLASATAQQNVFRPELETFASWRKDAWTTYADRVYMGVPCSHGTCGTLRSDRNYLGDWAHPEPDAWFNAWFETLRTAYGWYLHGKAAGDPEMMRKAESVLNLALSAPQQQGAFPTIYLVKSQRWVPSDGWAGYADSYHAFSMSWTAYWMLRWAEDLVPERRAEILSFVKAYGDFLLKQQHADGVIPSWYLASTLEPRAEFRDFNAETAPSALLLTELAAATQDARYLTAAKHAMDFITAQVLPRQRWFDFETYLSCARKPYSFYDSWTAQFPQNNLAEIQAPAAMLALFKATHEPKYLQQGQQMLDYLLLTQQVWSPPEFEPNLLGGFTTQNTDSEWSDARQGYAAAVLLDYFNATGSTEYLERAVAAARSTFAVAPWENWAHSGFPDAPGALTGFHWGTGSAMTTVELMQPELGDALIDAKGNAAVGFDACTVRDVSVNGATILFRLDAPAPDRRYRIRFVGLSPERTYHVQWNGGQVVVARGSTLLRDGLDVHL